MGVTLPAQCIMKLVATLLVGVVAVIHLVIMAAESFPTTHPFLLAKLEGQLGFAEGQGIHASPIVRNADLFNGFLAAGLFWGMGAKTAAFQIRVFFLSCVIIAGIFGAATLPSSVTLWMQTAPAAITLVVNWLTRPITGKSLE